MMRKRTITEPNITFLFIIYSLIGLCKNSFIIEIFKFLLFTTYDLLFTSYGEVAERLNAAVLKTVVPFGHREFKSPPLRWRSHKRAPTERFGGFDFTTNPSHGAVFLAAFRRKFNDTCS